MFLFDVCVIYFPSVKRRANKKQLKCPNNDLVYLQCTVFFIKPDPGIDSEAIIKENGGE